jgi:phosphoribosylformimino-5-aminoimidazole carboxamide ribotide isomerase
MIILPAIDIQDATPVRLYQGAFDTAEQVADDAISAARRFEAAGAEWLHMVDLDGARSGYPKNRSLFLNVVRQTGLKVELGGGIRTMGDIRDYLEGGISRVILGSVALRDPELVKYAVAHYGEAIAVGIDARDGYARGGGWLEESQVYYLDLARSMAQAGVRTIIYTDISRDGTLNGPNLDQYKALVDAVPDVHVIASGGIRNLDDIRALKAIGLYGAICGKSVYAGTLDLPQALELGREED